MTGPPLLVLCANPGCEIAFPARCMTRLGLADYCPHCASAVRHGMDAGIELGKRMAWAAMGRDVVLWLSRLLPLKNVRRDFVKAGSGGLALFSRKRIQHAR